MGKVRGRAAGLRASAIAYCMGFVARSLSGSWGRRLCSLTNILRSGLVFGMVALIDNDNPSFALGSDASISPAPYLVSAVEFSDNEKWIGFMVESFFTVA